ELALVEPRDALADRGRDVDRVRALPEEDDPHDDVLLAVLRDEAAARRRAALDARDLVDGHGRAVPARDDDLARLLRVLEVADRADGVLLLPARHDRAAAVAAPRG